MPLPKHEATNSTETRALKLQEGQLRDKPSPAPHKGLRLITEKPRTLLIHDGSGFGKTCLLLDLLTHLSDSGSHFALYLQGRVYSSTETEAERTALGLNPVLVGLIARAAEHRHTVVIIDSLDVLSLNREAALGFFLSLIDQIAVLPNVTVVAACRSFDLRYDSRLAHRDWTQQLPLGALDWTSEAHPLLERLDTFLHQLEELSDPLAWKGAAIVFATNAHQAQHSSMCHSRLESILKVTAAAPVVRSEMIYLFRATPAAQIPTALLESYFDAFSQDTSTRRPPLHDFPRLIIRFPA